MRQLGPVLAIMFVLVFDSPVAVCPAFGQPSEISSVSDYDYRSLDWNGLSELVRALLAEGVELVVDEPVDLSEHAVDSPLVIIYPTVDLPTGELLEFVRDGGRLLIADDFGRSDTLLEEVGIYRSTGELPHQTFYLDNPQLPLFLPPEGGSLLRGVTRVVGNHPAWLSVPVEPAIAYDQASYALVADVPVGAGRVIVLSDPSILINFMLDVADNQTLATNLLSSLCDLRIPCQMRVTTRHSAITGDYPAPPPEAEESEGPGIDEVFRESFSNVNDILAQVAGYRPNRRGVLFASMLLGLGISVFLFSTLPVTKPRWLGFTLRPSSRLRSQSEFEWNLERFIKGRKHEDCGLPLAILKEEFEDLFMGALAQHSGELEEERRYDSKQLRRFAQRFAKNLGERGIQMYASRRAAESQALSTLKAFAAIPSRRDLVPEVDGRYSERLMQKLYRQARNLLEAMEIWDQYEQRIGTP